MESPVYSVGIPVAAGGLVNYVIYGNGSLNDSMKENNPMLPPGYIIGIVWMALLAGLGYAHYLLYSIDMQPNMASISIVVLIVYCLMYPVIRYYKSVGEKELNIFSLCLTAVSSAVTFMVNQTAFFAVVPTLVWVSYVVLSDIIYP